MVMLNNVKNPDRTTLMIRGVENTGQTEQAVRKGLKNGLGALDTGVVPGHGWLYLVLARRIREDAVTLANGREIGAMEAVADALEGIYKTLAANAGQDPIDTLIDAKKSLAGGTEVEKIVPAGMMRAVLERARDSSISMLRTDGVFSMKRLNRPGGGFGGSSGVTIYTSDGCPYCTQAKEYLKSRGVSFREVNVSRDPAGVQEMMQVSGQTGTPVTVIKGQPVVGFDRARLDALLR